MLHKNILPPSNHIIHSWEVADAAALAALVVTADDVGKVAFQLDTEKFHLLVDDSPTDWQQILTGTALSADSVSISGTVVVGDIGTEAAGVDIDTVVHDSMIKVSEIGGTNDILALYHRHSLTLYPIMVGARSHSNTSGHSDVHNGDGLFGRWAIGYAGTNYKIFGKEFFAVDDTGTVSGTSAPGKWHLQLTPDGSKVPADVIIARNDKSVEFKGIAKGLTPANNINTVQFATTAFVRNVTAYDLPIACGDETTAITTGTKVTFRAPRAFTITGVKASLTTAQASGSIFTVDVKKAGVSIFSTLLTIDNTEKTSATAATAAVLSTTVIADDDEITVEVTQIGTSGANGLKVYIKGYIT